MNDKEIAEIRRRFRPDRTNITHVRGCYVNAGREIVTTFDHSLALAGELGVAGRVLFPGQVPGVARWYGAADLAVSASRSEGLPFNVMEAMHYGLPVVASRVKGHTDLLEGTGAGLLYPYGDWEACAGRIGELLRDRELAARMGALGRNAAADYELGRALPLIMAQYGALVPLDRPAAAASL